MSELISILWSIGFVLLAVLFITLLLTLIGAIIAGVYCEIKKHD